MLTEKKTDKDAKALMLSYERRVERRRVVLVSTFPSVNIP